MRSSRDSKGFLRSIPSGSENRADAAKLLVPSKGDSFCSRPADFGLPVLALASPERTQARSEECQFRRNRNHLNFTGMTGVSQVDSQPRNSDYIL